MELTTSSISNEIDKSIQEEFSISKAAWEDAKLRKESGQEPESISNEQIKKNDPILNTYKVLDDAIHGGMGSVWRVHHESWNVDLAMKRPQPRFFAEAGDRRKEEFIRECENWINLGLHPNIVSCYYVREIGGVPTIFSEWMDNGSLKDRIRDGSLYEGTEEEVQERILDIAIQTARGLKYSHENNLIHQDVKPGNILLTKGWDAKVADFGLAKAQSQLTDGTKPASSGYTIQYCPKEQAEGAPAEKWMDVYAWALTVLEMYAGKRLWETGAEAKEHCEEYFSQCRILISGTMCELLESCLNSPAENFLPFETILKNEYKEKFGYDYPRQEPEAAADSADSLNNMALSFLDLGYTEKAREIFEKADTLDKNNKTVFLNNLLLQWRSGKRSDIGTLRHFNENGILVMSQEEYNLALAQLYCENGDYKKAMKLAEQHEKELNGWKPLLEYLLLEPEIAAFEQTPSTGSKSRKVRVEEDDAKNLHLYNSSLPMRKQKMLLPAYVSNLEFCFNYMISPNEKMLVTVSDNNRAVQIWDTNTGKLIKRDVCRIYGRWSEVKFSTDSKLLIVCSNEMVRVFSTVDKYNQVFQFSFDEVPYSAAFSIKNKLMITGFSGGRICSYSLPEGKKLREYQVGDSDQNVKSVDLTPDGDLAVCCYGRNAICLMELPAGKCIQTFERHQNFEANIHAVRFSEDWTSVLYDETNLSFVRSEYGSAYRIRPHSYRTPMSLVKIKDTVTQTQEGRMLEELLTKAENALRNAKPQEASGFLEKARQLSGTQDVSRICRLNEKLSKFGKVSGIRAVWQEGSFSFGREKKYGVIAVDGRGRIYLEENVNMAWKVRVFEAGKGIKDLVGELRPSTLKDFVLSSDEEKAYIYSYSYVARSAVIECQISSGHYRSLKCEAEVRGFDLSDNEELIAIMTKDEEVHIYECKTERQLPYIYHCEGLSTIRFCGESLLYIVAKQKKVIWDYVNNRIVCENTGPEYYYFRPAISPDKHFVADLSEKKDCIEICNLKNGVIAAQCETQFPDKIEFVQKGRFLVTQKAKEETALFWDTETGNCIYKFSGGTLPAREFFFSGDGQRVYAVHAENTVTSWYIDYIYSFDN